MKKIILLFVSFIPVLIFAQAVKKGNVEITAGTGFGIYGASDNESNNDTSQSDSTAVAALLDVSLNIQLPINYV